ncbi:MAG: glycosyltransferase family 9 protein [Verrucomicrobia bacterium]|nr:glycosyltransferase family 9 protein [Verrucomicrobiota bacterium]
MASALDTRKLQLIDRWVGMPVCGALSLMRRLLGGNRLEASPVRPSKVLFIKFAEQGSTVLARPAIGRAIEMVGRENVHFLVFEQNRCVLDLMALIPAENVITVAHESLLGAGIDALRALKRVRRLRIDAVIDLEFFSRSSAALAFLTGARCRVGYHTFFGEGPYRGDLMTHRLLHNPYLHTSQSFQLMVEALGQAPAQLPTYRSEVPKVNFERVDFVASPLEQEEVRAILRRESGRAEDLRLILLNPNASDLLPLRKWPPERYVELARRLLERFPEVYVAMTGSPEEADAIDQIARSVGSARCFSLAGKTTLRQLFVLYTLSELLVTNDSGPAHFASMTPITVITLFGPETPLLFGALSGRTIPIWMQIPCSPCVNAYNNRQSPCRNNLCMQAITVDHVLGVACQSYLDRRLGFARASRDDGGAHKAVVRVPGRPVSSRREGPVTG